MAETIPEIKSVVQEAKNAFKKEFNEEANIVVYAPGRVNLIGEHIDYNDGFVMPMVRFFIFLLQSCRNNCKTARVALFLSPGDDVKIGN
jgi:galactokinase